MQNLRVLAGARGHTWRVERIDTFDRRTRLALARLARDGSGAGALIAVRPFEPLSRIETCEALRPVETRTALMAVERAIAARRAAFTLPAAERLRGDIHAWQLAPALAFGRGHARVLVADEAGTGKTVSAGLAIAQCMEAGADRRCLVTAPGHLLRQWQAELHDRLSLHAPIVDAASLLRLQREIPAGVTPWALPGCAIASIDFVKQPHVRMSLASIVWDLLVIDEAHLACGDSERHETAHLLASRSRAVLLLTATPSDGGGERVGALRSLGAGGEPLVHLRHAASARARVERRLYVRPTRATTELHTALDAYTQWIARGPLHDAPAVALLCSLLTKRALSSAHALVLSLERRLALLGREPEAMQPSLFEPDEDAGIIGAASGMPPREERDALEQLRQLAARGRDRKMGVLLRLMARTSEPAIIFTCFRDTALLLEKWLAPLVSVRVIHGELPAATIEAALRAFTTGPLRVLVATDVASQGLNLHQRCRWVIHYDLPWRPSTVQQRTGRVDRLGQTRRAHATFLLERTPLAAAAHARLADLSARMHAEEHAACARWNILAAVEAARLRALRSPHPCTRVMRQWPTEIAVVETEFVDGTGAIIERAVDGVPRSVTEAAARASREAARRRAQLARSLRTRTRRRIAREQHVLAAAITPRLPEWRQDGLFDRRAERGRALDAAARARLEQESGDAVDRHAREAEIAAARCRTIATFVAGGVSDAR